MSNFVVIIMPGDVLGHLQTSGWTAVTKLTHCGLVTPYGNKDLDQHWLREWHVAWRLQAITWTNVDLSSVRSSDNNPRGILQLTKFAWKLQIYICNLGHHWFR